MSKAELKVSVIMLVFNQEDYVESALESVLRQSGPAFEIIILDDCSTDKSSEKMKSIARNYKGPHCLKIFTNEKNLGFVENLNKAVSLATGDLLIPAYGDDLSEPTRMAKLKARAEEHKALLVHSDAISIDQNDQIVAPIFRKADFYHSTDPYEIADSMQLYLGASAAWHRSLFDKYGPLGHHLLFDDLTLGFRAALEGRVVYIDEPLIRYRSGIGLSFKNKSTAKQTRQENAARRQKILSRRIATFEQRLKDADTYGLEKDHPVVKKLERALLEAKLRRLTYTGAVSTLAGNLSTPVATVRALCAEGLRIALNR